MKQLIFVLALAGAWLFSANGAYSAGEEVRDIYSYGNIFKVDTRSKLLYFDEFQLHYTASLKVHTLTSNYATASSLHKGDTVKFLTTKLSDGTEVITEIWVSQPASR